jgi:hypothetical protein
MRSSIVAGCSALLAVALVLAGCGGLLPDTSVQLLTGIPEREASCFLMPHEAMLVADPKYGTAIGPDPGQPAFSPVPMAWRTGVTGRRLASGEVQVLDPNGRVIATTGQHITYYSGGPLAGAVWNCAAWEGYEEPN